jgi:hypothetical protein
VVLDATGSRDPDFVPSANEVDPALVVSWACTVQVAGSTKPQSCSDKNGTLLSLPSTLLATIPGNTLSPSAEAAYVFEVTVRKAGRIAASFAMPVSTIDVLALLPLPRICLCVCC